MLKGAFVVVLSVASINLNIAQSEIEIDTLLNTIASTNNSKQISLTTPAKKIISYGEKSLELLVNFFNDPQETAVFSDCHSRYLTKGELAIILADRIEMMPYYSLTRVQNCTAAFCDDNPNNIEYYLNQLQIRQDAFKKRYLHWLYSNERLDWPKKLKGKARRDRKKYLRARRLDIAKQRTE